MKKHSLTIIKIDIINIIISECQKKKVKVQAVDIKRKNPGVSLNRLSEKI